MIQIKEDQNESRLINATHWGLVSPVVEDGKIKEVLPFEEDFRPSPNLKRVAELPYCSSRIQTPAIRESFLKDGILSRENRGKDRWVSISWDQALDIITQQLKRVYREYGPSAVFGQSYGWKSPGALNSASTLQRRLLKLCGGFVGGVNSYSTAAVSTILPYVVGTGDPQSTDWSSVLKHAKTVVLWAADPLVTNDIDWQVTLHNYFPYLEKLKNSGIRTIDINPVRTETGAFLNSEWIAPKPGTDCALMLGIMYELAASELTDIDFMERCTDGFEEFKAYLMGETDGIPKTPEWASRITGIEPQKIRSLAHEWSEDCTMIMIGWGIQRIQYGEQPHWMAFTLASMLGWIGRPGGGIGTNYHYCSGGCPQAYGPFLPSFPSMAQPVLPFKNVWNGSNYIPTMRFADCFLNPGKTIDHNGRKITYPDIKLVMWTGGNPFAHQPQTCRLEEAWKKPEFVAVTDCFWTPTARQADIVLPAQTVFERNDIAYIGTYTNDGIAANKRAIEPLFESKSDFWIYSQLAKRLGCEYEFNYGLNEEQWIREIYGAAAREGENLGIRFPAFEAFWDKGYLLFPRPEVRPYVAFEDFRQNPAAYPLNTESGKIQIFSPRIASYGYDDCLGYPSYFEPSESLNRDLTKKYPLAFMSTKSSLRLHSQLDGTVQAERDDVNGREPVWIHPKNAAERGIVDGDLVVVRNDRGTLLAGAVVTENIREDVVLVHHGAWFDPEQMEDGSRLDVHGNPNTLTMDVPTSKLACGNIASSGLVQVEKFSGKVPPVLVREQPEFAKN